MLPRDFGYSVPHISLVNLVWGNSDSHPGIAMFHNEYGTLVTIRTYASRVPRRN